MSDLTKLTALMCSAAAHPGTDSNCFTRWAMILFRTSIMELNWSMLWQVDNIWRSILQQLFHQMGHDPVPNYRGVELIGQTDAVADRQHSEKHSHSQFSLNEIRDLREVLFTQILTHCVVPQVPTFRGELRWPRFTTVHIVDFVKSKCLPWATFKEEGVDGNTTCLFSIVPSIVGYDRVLRGCPSIAQWSQSNQWERCFDIIPTTQSAMDYSEIFK